MNKQKISINININITLTLLSSNAYANELISLKNTTDSILSESALTRGSLSSKWSSKTHDGRSYQNRSTINIYDTSVRGQNTIRSTSGSVPGGTMGTHVNLYNSSDKVIRTSDWYYYPSTVTEFTRTTPTYITKSGNYYTKSTNHLYTRSNGKYVPFGAIPSPKLSVGKMGITISKEELSEREYLYETKNMIAAVGENDIEGYISIDDLYGSTPESPEDALRRQLIKSKSSKQYRMIPLYSSDGETVIGEYRIDFNLDSVENVIVE